MQQIHKIIKRKRKDAKTCIKFLNLYNMHLNSHNIHHKINIYLYIEIQTNILARNSSLFVTTTNKNLLWYITDKIYSGTYLYFCHNWNFNNCIQILIYKN